MEVRTMKMNLNKVFKQKLDKNYLLLLHVQYIKNRANLVIYKNSAIVKFLFIYYIILFTDLDD